MLCSIIFYCICTRHNRTLECDCGFDMQNTLQSILTMLQFEGSYSPPVLSRAKDGNLGWTQATSSYILVSSHTRKHLKLPDSYLSILYISY